MKDSLEKLLIKKYPQLFFDLDNEGKSYCVCWGIECGDGWFDIIDEMCEDIMRHIEKSKLECPKFSQIKEKFGALRVYLTYGDDTTQRIVEATENKSYSVCEVCGASGKLYTKSLNWALVRCKKCKTV